VSAIKDFVKDHILPPLGIAMLLGSGSAIIKATIDNATQDERISRIEKLDASMEKLGDELATSRETLAAVKARQEK
jgi:hypothetical protein